MKEKIIKAIPEEQKPVSKPNSAAEIKKIDTEVVSLVRYYVSFLKLRNKFRLTFYVSIRNMRDKIGLQNKWKWMQ